MSIVELTNTRQWKDEPVIDYINRWRALSLTCKDKLSEASAIEMCIQGMHWGLIYILHGIKPRSFEELATRAHDMELSIANHKPKFPVGHQKKESTQDEDFNELATMESMTVKATPIKFSPNDEDTATMNVASITPTNDVHVLEKEQKALPSPLAVPLKLRLNSFEPIQMEAIPSKSNADEFRKLIIDEVPTSKIISQRSHFTRQYSSTWLGPTEKANKARHKTTLHYPKESNNQESSKAYRLLAKSGYDFSTPSRLGKLNPELTGEKIYGLIEAQNELRRQGFRIDQPRIGLGFTLDEPVRMHMKKKDNCVPMHYIAMEKGKNDQSGRPNDNHVFVFNQLGILVPRTSVFQRLGEAMRTSSRSGGHRQQGSMSNYLGDGYAQQLKKRSRYEETYKPKENRESQAHRVSWPRRSKTSSSLIPANKPIKVKRIVARRPYHSKDSSNKEDKESIKLRPPNHVSVDEDSDLDISKNEIQNTHMPNLKMENMKPPSSQVKDTTSVSQMPNS
ncbi:UNVERIFIED_CONTAM: hypothetical protein Slati_0462400 [Sesamum latifolium]|uniref:Uncharacterized protein n=1 Tax=Sesamum latifolium TaxID=2727402 RepID=A0AAW2XW44_9LAMI